MSRPIACMAWSGEAVPGQPDFIEAEFLFQLEDGRRVFKTIPGWYPIDSMGDPTGTLINGKWVEDNGEERFDFTDGEIP